MKNCEKKGIMKPKTFARFTAGLCLLSCVAAQAQFSSGSTGADGALVVTNDMILPLLPDGIFNFTTITISNATLSFTRNTLNTPVYLLATADVYINGNVN